MFEKRDWYTSEHGAPLHLVIAQRRHGASHVTYTLRAALPHAHHEPALKLSFVVGNHRRSAWSIRSESGLS